MRGWWLWRHLKEWLMVQQRNNGPNPGASLGAWLPDQSRRCDHLLFPVSSLKHEHSFSVPARQDNMKWKCVHVQQHEHRSISSFCLTCVGLRTDQDILSSGKSCHMPKNVTFVQTRHANAETIRMRDAYQVFCNLAIFLLCQSVGCLSNILIAHLTQTIC